MNSNSSPSLSNLPNFSKGYNNNPDANTTPNLSRNIPGQESISPWQKSITKSRQTRKATQTIIKSREQLKAFLQSQGMDLWTSAVEFQKTGDFIVSSYVVYPSHDNQKESMSNFLERYPQLTEAVSLIRDSLRPIQGQMQIIDFNN